VNKRAATLRPGTVLVCECMNAGFREQTLLASSVNRVNLLLTLDNFLICSHCHSRSNPMGLQRTGRKGRQQGHTEVEGNDF
jgi:hypothetical protein